MNRFQTFPRYLASWLVITIFFSGLASFPVMAKPPAGLKQAKPEQVGMNPKPFNEIDKVVQEGLKQKKMPGCVVLVGHAGKIVFLKAYGYKQLLPTKKKMQTDTLFDMASLTKPIVTATSTMILVERGLLNIDDTVAKHLPEFGKNGKENITITQMLTHQSGLLPDNSIRDYQQGPVEAMKKINALGLREKPGKKFIYSDVGFIVLAELVKHISKKNVHQFSQANIFKPLGMRETGYLPDAELRKRAAVTQQRNGKWMRGEVHDPRAYRLKGIAGHAGLFSTASDLAIYAQMMIGKGTFQKTQIMKPKTVKQMTTPHLISPGLRCLGWDSLSKYSSNRGKNFSKHAFGHGGFTGTSMWIDPELDLFVIFLSNRVHPDGKGSVNRLAGRIGTIAASALPVIKQKKPLQPMMIGKASFPKTLIMKP